MTNVRDIILKNDGMIFGGFVRDSIIHDHFATEFYDSIEFLEDYLEARAKYSDPSFIPHTKDRMLIPTDIDCIMTRSQRDLVLKAFKRKQLKWKQLFVRSPSEYFHGFDGPSDMEHVRYRVKVDFSRLRETLQRLPISVDVHSIVTPLEEENVEIIIDMLLTNEMPDDPFCTRIDFECNALFMTKHAISVSSRLVEAKDIYKRNKMTQSIITDIIQRRAVLRRNSVMSLTDLIRANKMFGKGWQITNLKFQTVKDDTIDEMCIICHCNVTPNHFKMTCCNSRFHAKCLRELINSQLNSEDFNNDSCPMCRGYASFTRSDAELVDTLYQANMLLFAHDEEESSIDVPKEE